MILYMPIMAQLVTRSLIQLRRYINLQTQFRRILLSPNSDKSDDSRLFIKSSVCAVNIVIDKSETKQEIL
jgi:hypothetical protein